MVTTAKPERNASREADESGMSEFLSTSRRDLPPVPWGEQQRVLVVAASHGFPATKARLERPIELVRALTASGAACDVVVLCERMLQPAEEDSIDDLRSWARRVEKISHPVVDSFVYQTISSLRAALSLPSSLGGRQHCPARLLSFLRSLQAEEEYRAVIVVGAHLARVLDTFPDWTEKLIDVERIGSEVHRSHARNGRPDVLQIFERPQDEIELLNLADAVLVSSIADATRLRELGLETDIVMAPPTGGVDPEAIERIAPNLKEPIRPARLLFVGSETPANLDALRWFRRQVFPRILKAVPSCRLRLVGESARHIEPGPGVDRIGWVDRLDEEYRDCALVVLPLRMGSGVRRRAIEALARHKALATTRLGAHGTGLVHQKDAIVSDDLAVLSAEIIRVLTSDAVRKAYEKRGEAIVLERYARVRAFEALLDRLSSTETAHSTPKSSLLCVSRT